MFHHRPVVTLTAQPSSPAGERQNHRGLLVVWGDGSESTRQGELRLMLTAFGF